MNLDPKKIEWENLGWIDLVQDRDKTCGLINSGINNLKRTRSPKISTYTTKINRKILRSSI